MAWLRSCRVSWAQISDPYFFAKMLPILLLLLACLHVPQGASTVPIEAFELFDVQLAQDTFQSRAAASNLDYLMQLEPDRMLWAFRANAKLPTPGVPFYGTWEDPGCELRGHFVGHYLTALSLVVMSTGNATILARLNLYIDELRKVQQALDEGGYLSAFPSEHFDRVEALKPVWAPYYVIHKIMAGLLDAHLLAGSAHALSMVQDMAAYFLKRTEAVIKEHGEAHWQQSLNTEFGGMNDVMYRLYSLTRDPDYARLASLFDKKVFWDPMVANRDTLGGLHANTHLAQVVGFAERSEATGDLDATAAVTNFFSMVTGPHAYATGGSNDKEFWFAPGMLGEAITNKVDSLETQEICTQYNVLKIARSLFRWTGDVKVADFYERTLVNGILGVSRLTNDDVYAVADHPHGHHGQAHHHHHHRELWQLADNSDPRHTFRSSAAGTARGKRRKGQATRIAVESTVLDASGGAGKAVQVHRRPFEKRFQDYWGMNLAKMPNNENATNVPGTPGVFLYLLPMGTGQSKGDNYHHWGYPMHSFWCCYGTAIESFAKLADSIYFHSREQEGSPAKLYVNQLVTSTLRWKELQVEVNTTADMFAPGPSAVASLTVTSMPGATAAAARFTLMMRVPEWSDPRRSLIHVNGKEWRRCPNFPSPSSYCSIARDWSSGDVVSVSLGLKYWFKELPDSRDEYRGLMALMMGPYVMAGLTHDTRALHLQPEDRSPDRLALVVSEPETDPDEMVSIQAAWNRSLYVRHDLYHAHMSVVEDGGDAIDATFRVVRGCQGPAGGATATARSVISSGSRGSRSRLGSGSGDAASAAHEQHMHHQMLVGLHDDHAFMLESVNMPGFYLGLDESEENGRGTGVHVLTLTQPGGPGAGKEEADGGAQGKGRFCRVHQFMLRAGLDGVAGTMSLESVALPTYFVTAARPGGDADAPTCGDDPGLGCEKRAREGACVERPEVYKVHCRKSCDSCGSLDSALTLRQVSGGHADPAATAASSFRMAQPLTHRLPPGSKVVAGANRRYLVAPLGNLVDERYTVYFNVQSPHSGV